MGEARGNPRSGQYQGPLPDQIVSARTGVALGPSEAWLEKMKSTLADLPPEEQQKLLLSCGRQNIEVSIGLQAMVVIPMRTQPQSQWPAVAIGLGVTKIPLLELLKLAKEQLVDQPALAGLISIPEEPKPE